MPCGNNLDWEPSASDWWLLKLQRTRMGTEGKEKSQGIGEICGLPLPKNNFKKGLTFLLVSCEVVTQPMKGLSIIQSLTRKSAIAQTNFSCQNRANFRPLSLIVEQPGRFSAQLNGSGLANGGMS